MTLSLSLKILRASLLRASSAEDKGIDKNSIHLQLECPSVTQWSRAGSFWSGPQVRSLAERTHSFRILLSSRLNFLNDLSWYGHPISGFTWVTGLRPVKWMVYMPNQGYPSLAWHLIGDVRIRRSRKGRNREGHFDSGLNEIPQPRAVARLRSI